MKIPKIVEALDTTHWKQLQTVAPCEIKKIAK